MFISSFGPLDPGAKFDEEGTGWGWKTVGVAASGAEFGTPSVISKTRCDSPVCLMPVFAAEIRKKRASAHARLSSVALAFGTRLPFLRPDRQWTTSLSSRTDVSNERRPITGMSAIAEAQALLCPRLSKNARPLG